MDKKESGLTLIELIVVIAIIAIASFAVTSFVSEIQEGQNIKTINAVRSALYNWQTLALTDGGAELNVNKDVITVTSDTDSAVSETFHAAEPVTLLLNGSVISCADMSDNGFLIAQQTGCVVPVPAGVWDWTLAIGGENVSVFN